MPDDVPSPLLERWREKREAFLKGQPPDIDPNQNPWKSRGYLSHFDRPGAIQSITFRLQDSLPASLLVRWEATLQNRADDLQKLEVRKLIENHLDSGHGSCWLKQPEIAKIVEDALLYFDGQRYRLLAWCVMPNHVHVAVETLEEWPVSNFVHSWKSVSAKKANRLLERTGHFWQREYHDRMVRDENHLANLIHYIHNNPVKAGLATIPAQHPFTSARLLTAPNLTPSAIPLATPSLPAFIAHP